MYLKLSTKYRLTWPEIAKEKFRKQDIDPENQQICFPLGPKGLAFASSIIGTVSTNWTKALKSNTSEGSILGNSLTITEQSVKKRPEIAARKMPRNFVFCPSFSSSTLSFFNCC
jgi:hypothetical protein